MAKEKGRLRDKLEASEKKTDRLSGKLQRLESKSYKLGSDVDAVLADALGILEIYDREVDAHERYLSKSLAGNHKAANNIGRSISDTQKRLDDYRTRLDSYREKLNTD